MVYNFNSRFHSQKLRIEGVCELWNPKWFSMILVIVVDIRGILEAFFCGFSRKGIFLVHFQLFIFDVLKHIYFPLIMHKIIFRVRNKFENTCFWDTGSDIKAQVSKTFDTVYSY